MNHHATRLLVPLSAALVLFSCGGEAKSETKTAVTPKAAMPAAPAAAKPAAAPTGGVEVDRAAAVSLFGHYPNSPVPKGNQRLQADKVALGKTLYHEKRLSRNGDISCASCHDLGNYGQDGVATSPGTGGAAGKRNTPTTFNAHLQFKQFWDYRAENVEEQSTMPILAAPEHGLEDEAEIVSILAGIPEYPAAFAKAFPKDEEPLNIENVRLALGAFERKLETVSRFDKFLDGDDAALTDLEKKGLNEFMNVGCTACHTTRLLGGQMVQKLGLVKPVETADLGRFEVTGEAGDKNMWKVPQLRNVEKTAPYLHDGSMATLEEVTKYMADVQLGRTLTDDQTNAIVAFMKALTGEPPAAAK